MEPSINLKQAIEGRRAARAFRSDPIPDAILQEILRLGTQAPSGFNLQPWRFIVVRSLENKQKLRACAFDQRQVEEAPVVLICCGDRNVSQSDYIESVITLGKEQGAINDAYADVLRSKIPGLFENRPCFESLEAWTNRHTIFAVAYLTIVARGYGVDSCPMEGFVTTQVKEAFKIPEDIDVCCILPLGYPAEPFKKYGGRFSLEQVCYGEVYGEEFLV
ncbi:MAG: nitroreductase family protein [Cyanobacteriota bacterium]|nr:nitroreductase family protein [Cyanobacteriota bacterium]